MELACLGFAKSGQHPDRLHRGEAAHQADHCAQDADFGAAITIISIMRIANKTAVARLAILPAAKRADLAVELANGGRNQRHLRRNAKIIDDQPRREIVAAVNHDINPFKQRKASHGCHPFANPLHRDIGVKLPCNARSSLNLGLADVGLSIKDLPLKIGAADGIIINHAQMANTRRRQILNRRTANPARADDEDMRTKQAQLPCPANLPQDDMAGIAIKLFIC